MRNPMIHEGLYMGEPLGFALQRNVEEASMALDEAGYALITHTPHVAGRARPLWETLQPDVVMSFTSMPPDQIRAIRAAGVRHIVPDPDGHVGEEYSELGPGLQVRHLAGLGHRRIAFAGSDDPRIADLVVARRDRAEEAALDAGVELVTSPANRGDEEAVAGWRAAGVTGVAAFNDEVALAVVGSALRLGLRVPEDLSVIGHDDIPVAAVVEPRLSTIRMDIEGLGRHLADLALSLAEGCDASPTEPSGHVELIQRDTTAEPGQPSLAR